MVVKKPLLFTPPSTCTLSPGTHLSTPYALARYQLHVSTLPASLPYRENEFTKVYGYLSGAIGPEGKGSCIYISGTPGTGKSATVREVISQLQSLVSLEELDDLGHKGVVKMLLEGLDVNPNTANEDGNKPLFWAARGGHRKLSRCYSYGTTLTPMQRIYMVECHYAK